MTKLAILEYPDPRLRTRAAPVAVVDDAVRQLIDDLLETMYASKGIGLAASQVDIHRRVLVLDISDSRDQPMAFINPEILEAEGRRRARKAACRCPESTTSSSAQRAFACVRWIATASRSSCKPTACSPCAFNMRWITSRASCSSTIYPSSSAS